MMHTSSSAENTLPGSVRKTLLDLRIADVQPVLPLHPDLE
jgi:hypothetical protein